MSFTNQVFLFLIPFPQIQELWREELLSNNQYLHELETCGVNLNMMNSFKKENKFKNSNSNNNFENTSGVYRKLNND